MPFPSDRFLEPDYDYTVVDGAKVGTYPSSLWFISVGRLLSTRTHPTHTHAHTRTHPPPAACPPRSYLNP